MKTIFLILVTLAAIRAHAELRISGSTAYISPDVHGARVSRNGVTSWKDPKNSIVWFGEINTPGTLTATVEARALKGPKSTLKLKVGDTTREAEISGADELVPVPFGEYEIKNTGFVRFELSTSNTEARPIADIIELVLKGEAAAGAKFNLKDRRNAASVHMMFTPPKDTEVALFYNEVTAVEDPTGTFYMACGFSRGYLGMQVNSLKERRLIFSVWDSGAGSNAKDRSTVKAEDQTQLLAKGEGVNANVFGNEGTGGHSHLVYPWKTGTVQRFVLAAKLDGTHTEYSGYWFHPDQQKWMLLAAFRAPKDGKYLRGLHSFSENFDGSNGHLRRKALYGPQWIRDSKGQWHELLNASFSHDPTGKADRLDRFMGVEDGRFFLSHGGFVEGFSKHGQPHKRPATSKPPEIELPNK